MLVVLGLVLLALAIALVVVAAVEGGGDVAFQVFDRDIDTTLWAVFAAGFVAGLLMLAAIATIGAGVRRSRARRREIDYLRQKVAQQERLRDERDQENATDDGVGDWLGTAHDHTRPAGAGSVEMSRIDAAGRPIEPATSAFRAQRP